MDFIRNFPAFSILLSLLCAVICSALPAKAARRLCAFANIAALAMSIAALWYTTKTDSAYVYQMGHFPAPWGNELRFGVLETSMGALFAFVLLAAGYGGRKRFEFDVEEGRRNLYYLLICLLQAAMLSIIYTNDIFSGYVFLEITTLASAGLLMIRDKGRATAAAVRYLIFNLLGSGLFLLGIVLLYDITGHLLLPNLAQAVQKVIAEGVYTPVLAVSSGTMLCGLAIKSGLFPFYYWMPDTYSCATPGAAAVISGLVSKVYILLAIKLIYRVLGVGFAAQIGILRIMFIFGVIEMLAASIRAIGVNRADRMLAYSSAAQIGYIYMGLGMGTTAGLIAALFHIITHALTKTLLFCSEGALIQTQNNNPRFSALIGSAADNKIAALAFDTGALSMVGIPAFAGFVSKYLFAAAAVKLGTFAAEISLGALALSTLLNTIYFLRTVINLHSLSRQKKEGVKIPLSKQLGFAISAVALVFVNLALGLHPQPIIALIARGIEMFVNI